MSLFESWHLSPAPLWSFLPCVRTFVPFAHGSARNRAHCRASRIARIVPPSAQRRGDRHVRTIRPVAATVQTALECSADLHVCVCVRVFVSLTWVWVCLCEPESPIYGPFSESWYSCARFCDLRNSVRLRQTDFVATKWRWWRFYLFIYFLILEMNWNAGVNVASVAWKHLILWCSWAVK